jgi:hypothetical protein
VSWGPQVILRLSKANLFGVWIAASGWFKISVQIPMCSHHLPIPVGGFGVDKLLRPFHQNSGAINEWRYPWIRLGPKIILAREISLPKSMVPKDQSNVFGAHVDVGV